jgi:uncharacterized protein
VSRARVIHVGVISDTHGLLRPEVATAFKGVEYILHGGDIGSVEVLESLNAIAPVSAVRGNNDKDGWAREIPEYRLIRFGDVRIWMVHDIKQWDRKFPLLEQEGKFAVRQAVISGHSHKPSIEDRDGVLFINPGSAGPRRFKLPVSVARLRIRAQ